MSYVGAAANIVGGELQGWASVLDKQAMFDAYKEELGRQQGYKSQAGAIADKAISQSGADEAQKDINASAGDRRQMYQDINNVPLGLTTPNMTSSSAARDDAYLQMRGASRAMLGAYGDWALHQTLNDIQNKEALRQVVNFAGGEAGVYPYRAYQAQHSMDDLAMVGAAISSIGGGGANYAQYAQAPGVNTASPTSAGGGGFQLNPYAIQSDQPQQFNPYSYQNMAFADGTLS